MVLLLELVPLLELVEELARRSALPHERLLKPLAHRVQIFIFGGFGLSLPWMLQQGVRQIKFS